MKLDVPNLLHIPEDDDHDVEIAFINMIHSFVQDNELREVILKQLVLIMVRSSGNFVICIVCS